MKNNLFLLTIVFSLCGLEPVQAQSGCGLHISADFNPECLTVDYIESTPSLWASDLLDCMLACKGNTVQYTAECPCATQFSWTISGATNYHFINQGRTVVVTWGDGVSGLVSVSTVVGDTNTCTAEVCVVLMDSPDANSSSVPAYYVKDGERVIEICLGETIEFTDMSTTPQTPITGYYWESPFGVASTENHSLTPLAEGEFGLVHCVRNECGCEDCEDYRIVVNAPVKLELSCYGTVCENTPASYSLINPPCDRYRWSVEGGSLMGQGTTDITVNWGSPASGYGVISLDASPCETECNSLLSVQIPVIIRDAEISGPGVVCVGEMQLYRLPRWGATEYVWWNSDSTSVSVHDSGLPNQYMLEFTHPDTLTINASYTCPFLDCGTFYSLPKTIVVKDTMGVRSIKDAYCLGDTSIFYTTHANPVQWKVFDQANHQICDTTADTLCYIFTSSGTYRITASHEDYCKVAEYHVTVLDNPPALTSTTGAHVACTGGSILLEATPTHPRYYLVWEPVCLPTSSEEGNEVTVTFGNQVCDVAVYQVDNEYNCRSAAFIHGVVPFQLLPHGLPAITTTCAGSTVQFNVPDQSPNVTYEWIIDPANAASIDSSDHLLPSVGILTNHLTNVTPPYLVDVKLKRTYCSGLEVNEIVQLLIEDVAKPILNCPDTVCEDELVTLFASGSTTTGSHCHWSFSDTLQTFQGTSVSRRFHHPGYVYVTVTYQPNPDCDPAIVLDTIWVNSKPYADITQNGGNLQVQYYPNVSYLWTYNGNTVSQNQLCSNMGAGTYCCTITDNVAPYCTDSDRYIILPGSSPCNPVTTTVTGVSCNEFDVSVVQPLGPQYSWSMSTQANGSFCSPTQSSNSTTAYINVLGTHEIYVYAEQDGQCYKGIQQVTVYCLPEISLSYDCNNHNIIVQDISQYLNGYSIPNRTVTIGGTSVTATIYSPQMSVSIPASALQGTYTITMTVGNTGCECSKNITIEHIPQISINIPANMCDNTPFQFSATPNNNHFQYYWDFGDLSYTTGNNIYHTYTADYLSSGRTVTLIVTNQLGCSSTITQNVNVCSNVFSAQPLLSAQSSTPVCPGTPRTIQFNSHPSNTYYTWSPVNPPYNTYLYDAFSTGDYNVEAYYSTCGCRAKATCNVGFLTAPWARIIGNTECCLGETVNLNGNTGANNTYAWTIAELPGFISTGPTLSFTPSQPGTYTVTLTVSNQGNCSATATCTLTVNPKPAAPSIAFYGDPCIHEPPVVVKSTTGQDLLWSNGYRGPVAYTYTAGYLTAHYLDPNTGCRSHDAQVFIEPAPDFSALLTGCYKMCPEQFRYNLQIYGIYPYVSSHLDWSWIYEPMGTIYNVMETNPQLPLVGPGDYFMEAPYAEGCVATSPVLTIEEERPCPCDSVFISVEKECKLAEDCNLYYNMTVTVFNNGSQPLSFHQLSTVSAGSIVSSVNPHSITVAPGGYQTITFSVLFTDYESPCVTFTLLDTIRGCQAKFTECFDWEECVWDECELEGEYEISFLPELGASHNATYFDVHISLPTSAYLVSLWSDPPQIQNYTSSFGDVYALMMLNYARLSQMDMDGDSVCLNAVVCLPGPELCYMHLCIAASEILEQIPEDFRHFWDSIMADNDTTRRMQADVTIPEAGKPYLAPNPANDEVTVMGIAPGEVAEITVLTLQGGQVAEYRNTHRFNVSRLAKATYIVRVITTDKRVYYLKLVKH